MYDTYMSALLQIRNVPETSRRELKARAALRGLSLNAYLLALIEKDVARPSIAEVIRRAESRSERATGSALDAIIAERKLREDSVADRRSP